MPFSIPALSDRQKKKLIQGYIKQPKVGDNVSDEARKGL